MTHMGQPDLPINCPRCYTPMIKQPDANVPSIIIDVCPSCGGTWFDYGELPAVINAVASQPRFRVQPPTHFGHGHAVYGGHHRPYHHGSSGFFGSFFSS